MAQLLPRLTQEQLNGILDRHEQWLREEEDGARGVIHAHILDELSFAGRNLAGIELFVCRCRYADFQKANLAGANLKGTDFSDCLFQDSILDKANMETCILKSCNFSSASLVEVNLTTAYMVDANMLIANCTGANFSSANLNGASFYEAVLERAKLYRVLIHGASFENANLQYVQFTGSGLQFADFSSAVMNECSLGITPFGIAKMTRPLIVINHLPHDVVIVDKFIKISYAMLPATEWMKYLKEGYIGDYSAIARPMLPYASVLESLAMLHGCFNSKGE